jgi:hypothetical protein
MSMAAVAVSATRTSEPSRQGGASPAGSVAAFEDDDCGNRK